MNPQQSTRQPGLQKSDEPWEETGVLATTRSVVPTRLLVSPISGVKDTRQNINTVPIMRALILRIRLKATPGLLTHSFFCIWRHTTWCRKLGDHRVAVVGIKPEPRCTQVPSPRTFWTPSKTTSRLTQASRQVATVKNVMRYVSNTTSRTPFSDGMDRSSAT